MKNKSHCNQSNQMDQQINRSIC